MLTNKGTVSAPQVKARLVAQEFATPEGRGELFAGTPGLAVLRTLISNLMTGNKDCGRVAMVLDVKHALLYGIAKRNIFVRLPVDACDSSSGRTYARLLKSLYGTRDAPQIWQEHLTSTLREMGFRASRLHVGVFVHDERGIELAVHVDDIFASGESEELLWMRRELLKRYELKGNLFEPGATATYLGRSLHWHSSGITWTHDSKHTETLFRLTDMETANAVATPVTGEEYVLDSANDAREPMPAGEARKFRQAAARVNYLAQDRPDLAVASCMLARAMSCPKTGDEAKLKRVIRYLRGTPSVSIEFEHQDAADGLVLSTDSDWATCKQSRRSCSGGLVQRGVHLLHFWTKLQPKVAPSSGDAELLSGNRGLQSWSS